MTDWRALPGGLDLSHWNGRIDWPRLASERHAFVILKATDGMGVDPMFDRNRKGAADNKIPWLWYPFLEPADNDAAIEHAIRVVGDKSIPPALDWEKAGVASRVMERWITLCEAEARLGLAYYGLYPPDTVTAAIKRWLRWFAQYPGSDTAAPKLQPWDGRLPADWSKQWFIWQWSEKGRDPAAPEGPVDLDRLACSVDVFHAWYDHGVLPSTADAIGAVPPPPPPIARPVLRLNMTGDDVLGLQTTLRAKGFMTMADGVFGPGTRRAVVAFQQSKRLPADGVAGRETRAALAG